MFVACTGPRTGIADAQAAGPAAGRCRAGGPPWRCRIGSDSCCRFRLRFVKSWADTYVELWMDLRFFFLIMLYFCSSMRARPSQLVVSPFCRHFVFSDVLLAFCSFLASKDDLL